MCSQINGQLHKIQVQPGESGRTQFMAELRSLMGYDNDTDFDVVFDVKVSCDSLMLRIL